MIGLLFCYPCMAYLGSQSVGQVTSHEEIIAVFTNVGVGNDNLNLSIDTTNIINIDVLEVRFRPDPAEVLADLDCITMRWKNTNLKTNAGEHYINISPSPETGGMYRYEPNHPPNLYHDENGLHSHLAKKFALELVKLTNGARLQTSFVLLRLKVTKFMSQRIDYVKKMESIVLNQ